MTASVLIADDEALIRRSVRALLVDEGFEVQAAASGAEAWTRFQEMRPDVVLLDLVLGDADGLELLRRMKQEAPDTKVILISAHGSIESAVSAMKLGGYDFIKKPFELEEIVAAVGNALRTSRLEQRVAYLAAQERRRSGGATFVHAAPEMLRLLAEVEVIAKSPVPLVLVTGESGTGKQAIARMLHEGSARAAGPFVELNCSAIPENLVESELFGHERGAFSDARERKLGLVEIAEGGTLFLDEIGDLGAGAQAKLLTFLEQRTFRRVGATAVRRVDARVVAATNRDLPAAVAAHTFREDLFYRVNAITVHLPPLRARVADVRPLAEHFLAESAREFGRRFQAVAPETVGLLERYRWPGNVRELRAVISRAALLHDDDRLRPAHLPAELVSAALSTPAVAMRVSGAATASGPGATIPTLEAVELAHIRRVLEICGGNRTVAAQHLGITRQTLAKKIGSDVLGE
jgi:two-component system, NtrC family, response regulator AtoC